MCDCDGRAPINGLESYAIRAGACARLVARAPVLSRQGPPGLVEKITATTTSKSRVAVAPAAFPRDAD